VAYLGGARCDAPLWSDHENFLQATSYEKVRFFAIFQQELQNLTMFDGLLRFQISEKWANLRFPSNIQKQKVFQLQGGFATLTPRQGALPLDPSGGSAPDPRCRLAFNALAMPPPLPNPKYATDSPLYPIVCGTAVTLGNCFSSQPEAADAGLRI